MTKAELIEAVATRSEVGKKNTEVVINATMDVIKETIAGGSDVMLVGFGTFTMAERAERIGHNPQTGEEIRIPAAKSPKFRSGKAFKEMVNAKGKEAEKPTKTDKPEKTEQTAKLDKTDKPGQRLKKVKK